MANVDRIKKLTKIKGWSLAYLCKQLGISHSYFTDVKNGKTKISTVRLSDIAKFLGTTPEYILGLTDDPSPHAENINNSVVLQGNTGNNTISNGATTADANPNSELEDEVLRVFRQLDMRAKNKALTFLYDLEESERS